jgi:hypothetical protein
MIMKWISGSLVHLDNNLRKEKPLSAIWVMASPANVGLWGPIENGEGAGAPSLSWLSECDGIFSTQIHSRS